MNNFPANPYFGGPGHRVGPSFYSTFWSQATEEPKLVDSFRTAVKTAAAREQWRKRIVDLLEEAFDKECDVDFQEYIHKEKGATKVLTISWEP